MMTMERDEASSALDEALSLVQEEDEYDDISDLCGSLSKVKVRYGP